MTRGQHILASILDTEEHDIQEEEPQTKKQLAGTRRSQAKTATVASVRQHQAALPTAFLTYNCVSIAELLPQEEDTP